MGFYDDFIYRLSTDHETEDAHKPVMPSDVVPVSDDEYAALFDAQANGQIIVPDAQGNPIAVDPPEPTGTQATLIRAKVLIGQGVAIESPTYPGISGVYAVDSNSFFNLLSMVNYVQANGAFPSNAPTLTWADTQNIAHTFTAPSEFVIFANAAIGYVTTIQQVINNGGVGNLPLSNIVTIT